MAPLLESLFKLGREKSSEFEGSVDEMLDLANKNPSKDWEMKLVSAIKDSANGYVDYPVN